MKNLQKTKNGINNINMANVQINFNYLNLSSRINHIDDLKMSGQGANMTINKGHILLKNDMQSVYVSFTKEEAKELIKIIKQVSKWL